MGAVASLPAAAGAPHVAEPTGRASPKQWAVQVRIELLRARECVWLLRLGVEGGVVCQTTVRERGRESWRMDGK